MSNRIPISKKLRFEVFKRDKFQCQYCGRKAPDVVLEVDHITPVATGGDNNITNLITSCFDCNRGKKDTPLNINQTLEKQRLQMEILQEKREQLEMIFEWRKELNDLEEYQDSLFSQYIEDKIKPFTMTDQFKHTILKTLSKYSYEDIITAIDLSAKKYLRYDDNGELTQDSVNNYLNKIGGILNNAKMPPIQQKINYVKGICRNRFEYFDNRRANQLLNEYVDSLKSKGLSEEQIIQDLETDVVEITKNKSNWSQWKNHIEKWIDDISKWETENDPENEYNTNQYYPSIENDNSEEISNETFDSTSIENCKMNTETMDDDVEENFDEGLYSIDMASFCFIRDIKEMIDYTSHIANNLCNCIPSLHTLIPTIENYLRNWLHDINQSIKNNQTYDWNDFDTLIRTNDCFSFFDSDDKMQIISKKILIVYIKHVFLHYYQYLENEHLLNRFDDISQQIYYWWEKEFYENSNQS